MDTASILQAWHEILPSWVSVSAGPLLDRTAPLSPEERRSAGEVSLERLRELENGRWHAKRALAQLGAPAAPVPIGTDRSPEWPEGIVGSISHAKLGTGGFVVAAVARASRISALGIDVEAEGALDSAIWRLAFSAGEGRRLLELAPPLRGAEAKILWCVKEAALKAARRRIDAQEIDVQRTAGRGGSVAVWRISVGNTPGAQDAWKGQSIRIEGLVLAAVLR